MLSSIARMMFRSAAAAGLIAGVCFASTAQAETPLTRGFEKTVPPSVINEEIVRQPDFWTMEVQLKPMRMVWVNGVDPESKEVRREQVWYLPWRAIRRPVSGRPTGDIVPLNELDPLPGPPMFIPEFTLVTYDNPDSEIPAQVLIDDILPDAMREVRRVERGDYLNTVSVVQELPEAVPVGTDDEQWIYGAATWKGIDPDTDFFKVILSGFSNGYEIKAGPNDEKQVWRKVIVQRFARPGDRYDPNQTEFKFSGDPEWVFQPDAAPPAAAQIEPTPRPR